MHLRFSTDRCDHNSRPPAGHSIRWLGWATLVAGICFGSGVHASIPRKHAAGIINERYERPVRRGPPGFTPMTLALKFVEFAQDGRPVLTEKQAERVVDSVNSVYAQCGLRVRMEQYEKVDPYRYGLGQKIKSADEMDSVRTPFDSDKFLVIIHTGAWDHGPMGAANAWTAMPGQLPAGAVLEAPVAANGNITAHELGHYLGLDHASNESELMNPIIYSESIRITPSQCEQMRSTAVANRAGALRSA